MPFSQVLQTVKILPFGFRKAFDDRVVNNIYFDEPGYAKLRENRDGIAVRNKLRVRWYGEKLTDEITLEIKGKKNDLGTKEQFNINLSQIKTINELTEKVKIASRKSEAKIFPVIINQYRRSYFVNPDKNVRITVDRKLKFFPLFSKGLSTSVEELKSYYSRLWTETPSIILEMKYSKEAHEEANEIAQQLPFRMTKYSKFAMGLQHLFNQSV